MYKLKVAFNKYLCNIEYRLYRRVPRINIPINYIDIYYLIIIHHTFINTKIVML